MRVFGKSDKNLFVSMSIYEFRVITAWKTSRGFFPSFDEVPIGIDISILEIGQHLEKIKNSSPDLVRCREAIRMFLELTESAAVQAVMEKAGTAEEFRDVREF